MVTIIMPVHNNKELFRQALESLCLQTKKLFRVYIVDDNSEEDIQSIVSQFKDKLNIIYRKLNENIGPGLARQIGLDAIYKQKEQNPDLNLDYVMFMDSDDLLYPRAVEVLHREAIGHNVDMLYSQIMRDEKGGTGGVIDNDNNTTWLHGKIYRVDFLKDNNIRFLDSIKYNEDAYFNLVAAFLAKRRFHVQEVTYLWRDNKKSVTRTNSLLFKKEHNVEYLISQVEAILKILDSVKDAEGLIPTLSNIYCSYQYEKYLYHHNTNFINEKIIKIFNNPKIIKIFDKKPLIKKLAFSIPSSVVVCDSVYFFSENFIEWMNNFQDETMNQLAQKLIWKIEE